VTHVPELGCTVADELLRPTRLYVKPVLTLAEEFKIKAVAHITGGGITGNLPRVLPEGCGARISKNCWVPRPVFPFIQEKGGVEEDEMYRSFNMGIGLTLVIEAKKADKLVKRAGKLGEQAFIIGEITQDDKGKVAYDE